MKLRENFCRGEAVLLAERRTILWSVRAFLFHGHVVPLSPKLPLRPTVPGNYRSLVIQHGGREIADLECCRRMSRGSPGALKLSGGNIRRLR